MNLANDVVSSMASSSEVGAGGNINRVILNTVNNDAGPEKMQLGEKIANSLIKWGSLGQVRIVGCASGCKYGYWNGYRRRDLKGYYLVFW